MQAVKEWLLRNFVPETARGIQGTLEATLEALRGASAGLGAVGIVLLVLAGGKLLATLQRTFTQIWGAGDFRSRLRRMAAFWGAVALSPFLVLASIVLSGATETLAARGLLPGDLAGTLATRLLPAVPGWAAILLLFRFCGGRRTPWRAAVLGATLAAFAWEVLKFGFALYLREAVLAETVLTGLGVVPVFLLWLYLSWASFLWGAEFAFVARDYGAALEKCGLRPGGAAGAVSGSGAPGGPPPAR
jgi:membrane protein